MALFSVLQDHPQHGLKSSPTLVKVLQPITPSSAAFNASDDNTPITGCDDTICGQLAYERSELCEESQATQDGWVLRGAGRADQ